MSVIAPAEMNLEAPEAVLQWAFETFPRLVIVASFQAESSVLIDMAFWIRADVSVLTLDTGRLPQATHDMIDRIRDRYAIDVQVVSPDAGELEEMVGRHGVNLFYGSADNRRLCCDVRKSRPLARALEGYDAWITGVRREETLSRRSTRVVEFDEKRQKVKVNPIARWTADQVDEYIANEGVLVNPLVYDGYPSIGCRTCTLRVEAGADPRSGRWAGTGKTECGIHV